MQMPIYDRLNILHTVQFALSLRLKGAKLAKFQSN